MNVILITESQNELGRKGPLKSSSPTYDLIPPHQLNHGHVQSILYF